MKSLELKDDGSVPKGLVKESNEAVDLLSQADNKLKRVLEMYSPNGRGGEKRKPSPAPKKLKLQLTKPKPPILLPIK